MRVIRGLPGLILLLGACATQDETNTCLVDGPVRVASLPDEWTTSGARSWDLRAVDELLRYGISGTDVNESAAVLIDPCTQEVAPYASVASDPLDLEVVSTTHGRLLYGSDGDEVFVLDRLDTPGFDTPRQIDALPAITYIDPVPGGALLCTLEDVDAPGRPRACWLHDGDAARPARALGADVARWLPGSDRLFLLHTSGVLRSIDEASGAITPIATKARRLWLAPEQRHLLWEAGDDTSVAMHRRDLHSGEELVLLPDLEPDAGSWIFNGDGTAAGFVGAGVSTFEAVFRLDTGAPLAVPEHTAVSRSSHGPEFELGLPDPELHVRAYWNPFTPDPPRVWFRDLFLNGGELYPHRSGDVVVYSMPQICDPTRSMWRVDLTTGARVRLASDVSGAFVPLDDGRYLTSIAPGWSEVSDIVVIDPETGQQQQIAESVDDWYHDPDRGRVFYLRATVPGAGVWSAPLPARD